MFTHTRTHEGERTGPQDLNPRIVSVVGRLSSGGDGDSFGELNGERRSPKQQPNRRDTYEGGEESPCPHRFLLRKRGPALAGSSGFSSGATVVRPPAST
jgi:hypothetical protein